MSIVAADLVARITADTASAVRGISGFGGHIAGLASTVGIAALALGGLGIAAAAVTTSFLGPAAQMETFETQLGTLMGSADAAKQRLQELAKFGAETPFELTELVQAEKVLQGFGLTGQKALQMTNRSGQELFTALGDIAAGTGTAFNEIALNFGKFSAGATGEAISRFQELGIATREQMAEMGIQFSKSGELLSPLPDAMQAVLDIAGKKFGGGMDALSKTFEGRMSSLQDAWDGLVRTLGTPLLGIVGPAVAWLAEFLGGPVTDAVQSFTDQLGPAFASLGPVFQIAQDSIETFKQALAGDWVNADTIHPFTAAVGVIATVLSQQVMPALHAFGAWFQNQTFPAFSRLQEAVSLFLPRLAELQPKFEALFSAIGPIVERVAPAFQAIAGAIALLTATAANTEMTILATEFEMLPSIIGAAVDGITAFLQAVPGAIDNVAAFVTGTLIPAWQQFAAVAGPVIGPAVDTLVTAFQNIPAAGQAVAGFFTGTLLPALQSLWDMIAPILVPTFNEMVDAFMSMLPALQQLGPQFGAMFSAIGSSIGPVSQLVSAAAESIGRGLVPALQVAGTVLGFFAAILGTIVVTTLLAGMSALKGIFEALPSTISAVVSGITTLIQGITTGVQGMTQIVRGLLSGDWTQIWNGAGLIVDGFVQMVSGLLTGLGGIVGGLLQAVVSTGATVLARLAPEWGGEIENVKNTIINTIKSIDLGKLASDMMMSLVNGIRSRITDVQEALRFLRSFFPSSPAERGPWAHLPEWDSAFSSLPGALGEAYADMRSGLDSIKAATGQQIKGISDQFKYLALHFEDEWENPLTKLAYSISETTDNFTKSIWDGIEETLNSGVAVDDFAAQLADSIKEAGFGSMREAFASFTDEWNSELGEIASLVDQHLGANSSVAAAVAETAATGAETAAQTVLPVASTQAQAAATQPPVVNVTNAFDIHDNKFGYGPNELMRPEDWMTFAEMVAPLAAQFIVKGLAEAKAGKE